MKIKNTIYFIIFNFFLFIFCLKSTTHIHSIQNAHIDKVLLDISQVKTVIYSEKDGMLGNLELNNNLSSKMYIFAFSCIYFLIASYYDYFAKRIVDSKFFFLFTEFEEKEEKIVFEKINRTANFEFIIKMREIKNDIDFLYNYRYFIYFFILVPFFHNNLKKTIFNIRLLYEKINNLNFIIINQ